jgi:hypothetical protein
MRVTSLLCVLSIGACATGTESDPEASAKIMANTISFTDIVANHAAMTQLASAKFSLNNPAAASMLATPGSRQVLDYLVGCALPKNQSFTVNAGGTTYKFTGDAGLARSWSNTKLNDKQKRWISACMLARVNNQGQLMKISMRGPHKALRVTADEVSRFSQEEGVYYGNIFTGAASVVGWSCRGKEQAAGEPDGSALSYRDCAEPTSPDASGGDIVSPSTSKNQCGWGYSGDCFVFNAGLPFACEKRVTTGGNNGDDNEEDGDDGDFPAQGGHATNTYYEKCHAGGDIPLLQPLWKEVVTVYVENGPPSLD